MRLIFAGTPDAAVPSLRLLAESTHEIALVVTRPDAPRGRKRTITPSPVADFAQAAGLPVLKTVRLDEAATAQITGIHPDLGVIVAYGGLVREPLLSAPDGGWVNLHFSLLPRWRGAAPVQHALIAGDKRTGASVFRLVPELDAGAILGLSEYVVPPHATAGEVLDALAHRGAYLLRDVVDDLASGRVHARPQEGEVTLAPKLTLEDGRVRWQESAESVLARIHATTPEPGAFTTIGGTRVKVLDARPTTADLALEPGVIALHGGELFLGTADHPVIVDTVQPAGKPAMRAADWWRGLRTEGARAQ